MPLSNYEKQVLEEMEAELLRADPELASTMSESSDPVQFSKPSRKLSPRNIAAGTLLALAGLGVILLGVSMGYGVWSIVVGVIGFIMMVLGVLLVLRTDRIFTSGRKKKYRTSKSSRGAWGRFMEGQNDRWDRRDDF